MPQIYIYKYPIFKAYLKNGIPNQKILLLILGIYFIVPPTISSNSFVIAC